MNPVSITLTFPNLHEAQVALTAVENACCPDSRQVNIAFVDRPDTGVSAGEKAAIVDAAPSFTDPFPPFPAPFNPFGATVPGANPFAAASTAGAAAAPTVPEAPPATSTATTVPTPPAPPTVPAATAPVVPAAPTSPAGIVVDSAGLPWDSRIHAGGGKDGNKPTNKDGTWRQKRGLNDAALKARVEAELRQAMGAPAASVPVPLPPSVPTTAAPSVATTAPPAIPAPPVAVTTTPTGPDTFSSLAARLGPHFVSGKLTQEQLGATLAVFGLTSMGQLPHRPDLVPAVAAQLDALVAA